jgi:hypothetical protein
MDDEAIRRTRDLPRRTKAELRRLLFIMAKDARAKRAFKYYNTRPIAELKAITTLNRVLQTTTDDTYHILDLAFLRTKVIAVNNEGKDPAEPDYFTEKKLFELLFELYGGKGRINVSYQYSTPAGYTDYKQTKNNEVQHFSFTYDIPDDYDEFLKWTQYHYWDWVRDSDTIVFNSELGSSGRIFITPYNSYLKSDDYVQLYRDDIEGLCWFNSVFPTPNLADRCYNALKKQAKLFLHGATLDELNVIYKKAKIKVSIHSAFGKKIKHIGETDTKIKRLVVHLQQHSKSNHLTPLHDKTTVLSKQDFMQKYDDLNREKTPFQFKYYGDIMRPYKLITQEGNYTYTSKYKEWKHKQLTLFKPYELDDYEQLELSQFIRCGVNQASSGVNRNYDGKLNRRTRFKHADEMKAYKNFNTNNPFYKGLLGKITDFRRCDKVQGVGYYFVSSFDWTNATNFIKDFQKAFTPFISKSVIPSPIIEYLQSHGVDLKIRFGCWGTTFHYEFDEESLTKDKDNEDDEEEQGIRFYAKFVGSLTIPFNNYDNISTFTSDEELVKILTAEYGGEGNETGGGGGGRINYNKETQHLEVESQKTQSSHLAHIGGLIYAYSQINLFLQMEKIGISNIYKINVDGIYFKEDADYKLNPNFRLEGGSLKGLLNSGSLNGLLGNRAEIPMRTYDRIRRHIFNTSDKPFYKISAVSGQGGSGKTYQQLDDLGLIRKLYVAPTLDLLNDKREEFKGLQTRTIQHIIYKDDSSYPNIKQINQSFNTIILDEGTQIHRDDFVLLKSLLPEMKIIICGDFGFQIDPINRAEDKKENARITGADVEHTFLIEGTFRTSDPLLIRLMDDIRTVIGGGVRSEYLKNYIGQKVVFNYDEYKDGERIIVMSNNKKDEYNNLLKACKKSPLWRCKKPIKQDGEIVHFTNEITTKEPLDKTNWEAVFASTCYSLQGQTLKMKFYIDCEVINNFKVFYTAVSRATRLSDIVLIYI